MRVATANGQDFYRVLIKRRLRFWYVQVTGTKYFDFLVSYGAISLSRDRAVARALRRADRRWAGYSREEIHVPRG